MLVYKPVVHSVVVDRLMLGSCLAEIRGITAFCCNFDNIPDSV